MAGTELLIRDANNPEMPGPEVVPTNMVGLMALALKSKAGIDVVERLKTMLNEERDYQSRVSFDEALNRCQSRLARVAADADNPQTHSKYATYAKLDKAARPVYTSEGFSVSFGEKDCPYPGKTRFVAYLSRSGVTREYLKDLTPSTKGPQGKEVMTPIHADGSAGSYAKRYLLKDIFNIAIGEEDNDGNSTTASTGEISEEVLVRRADAIMAANDDEELKKFYLLALNEAQAVNDQKAQQYYSKAKNQRYRELHPKGAR